MYSLCNICISAIINLCSDYRLMVHFDAKMTLLVGLVILFIETEFQCHETMRNDLMVLLNFVILICHTLFPM